MRIRDWSSDVCSSDLPDRLAEEFARVARRAEQRLVWRDAETHHRAQVEVEAHRDEIDRRIGAGNDAPAIAHRLADLGDVAFEHREQIGRGAGRGRVCPYV